MDQKTQLENFARAVALLGGNTATARALGMSERSVRYLLDGTRRLHAGVLEDLGKALIAHADECRELERKLSPAFAGNRTEAQEKPPLHRGRPSKPAYQLRTLFTQTRNAGKTPDHWIFSHSFYDRLVADVGWSLEGKTVMGLPWEVSKDENLHQRGFVLETVED